MVIHKLRHKYTLGQVLHRSYQFGTGYLTIGKHYITINGQVIVQLVSQPLDCLIIKMNGRVILPPVSVSVIEVKTQTLTNTTNLYKINADIIQLPDGAILLDILHRVNHKTPQHLNILVLNTNNVSCSIGKNMPLHPCTLWDSVGKFRRLAGAASNVTPPNSYCKCSKIPVYNWNHMLKG